MPLYAHGEETQQFLPIVLLSMAAAVGILLSSVRQLEWFFCNFVFKVLKCVRIKSEYLYTCTMLSHLWWFHELTTVTLNYAACFLSVGSCSISTEYRISHHLWQQAISSCHTITVRPTIYIGYGSHNVYFRLCLMVFKADSQQSCTGIGYIMNCCVPVPNTVRRAGLRSSRRLPDIQRPHLLDQRHGTH